jgi:Amt family ammonium transporter
MNTLLSGAIGALTTFFFKPYFMQKVSPISNLSPASISNGLLAGLVSVTASCNNIEPYIALVIGFIGGFVYIFSCWIWVKVKLDDPLDAS